MIFIPSGGLYVGPWASNPCFSTKKKQIWSVGADGLNGSFLFDVSFSRKIHAGVIFAGRVPDGAAQSAFHDQDFPPQH